jgi:16S rRNA (uracil1498-N3)-methyltransferase
MADRFYSPGSALRDGGLITLEGDEARHLARVRRVQEGAIVEVFDGAGRSVRAKVVAIGKTSATLEPEGPPSAGPIPPLTLTLASAAPKGDRIDWLIEKATELGAARFVPLLTERSVVDPRSAKLDRLRRTVVEACKQCGRNRLMTIVPPTPWAELLVWASRIDHSFVGHPGGEPFPRSGRLKIPGSALVAIGPEGGFTEAEVDQARSAGFRVIGLGATLLRVETAALAACVRLLALAETEKEGL